MRNGVHCGADGDDGGFTDTHTGTQGAQRPRALLNDFHRLCNALVGGQLVNGRLPPASKRDAARPTQQQRALGKIKHHTGWKKMILKKCVIWKEENGTWQFYGEESEGGVEKLNERVRNDE